MFACQPHTTGTNGSGVTTKEPNIQTTNSSGNNLGGTSSTGGGNGINKKPLEAYITDLTTLDAYKNYVTPIIEKLKADFPDLAADFMHISLERDWYIIPIDLDQISKNVLGSYGITDQMALQDLKKVWINKKLFEEMSEQDQAILITHEILMGIRLMAFKNKQDQCIAHSYRQMLTADTIEFKKQKQNCRMTYPQVSGAAATDFKLNSDDYDNIRSLVGKLTRSNIDVEDIQDFIKSNQFRNY